MDSALAARRDDAGFTFVELIVALAIMVMIASVVTPVLFSTLDRARIDTAKANLQGFSDAIDAFEADVKEHPGYLNQLESPIETWETNVCGSSYKSGPGKGGTATWNGPYLDRTIPVSGRIPVGIGIADDQLVRVGERTRAGYMAIIIREVTAEDAAVLDAQLDGSDGPTGGAIQWELAGDGYVLLSYVKPSPRC